MNSCFSSNQLSKDEESFDFEKKIDQNHSLSKNKTDRILNNSHFSTFLNLNKNPNNFPKENLGNFLKNISKKGKEKTLNTKTKESLEKDDQDKVNEEFIFFEGQTLTEENENAKEKITSRFPTQGEDEKKFLIEEIDTISNASVTYS